MSFQEYVEVKKARRDVPMVSILKHGVLSVNQVCHAQYLKKYKFVKFFFDEKSQKIGLKPTNEDVVNAYPIRSFRNGVVFNISAKSFLNHYKIPHIVSKSYQCQWNSKEEMLEISLK